MWSRLIARARGRCVCVALALVLAPSAALATEYELTPIALAGDVAPETGGGTFNFFYTPSALNDAGELAFGTSMTGGTAFSAAFVYSGGALDARMIFGTPAPDVGGTYGAAGSFPKLSQSGLLSNMSTLVGASVSHGIFTDDGTSDTARVISGTTAPDTGGGSYATAINELSLHSFDDAGRITFISPVSGGSVTNGIFVSDGVADVSVALQGESAPDTGGTYDTFTYLGASPTGSVAFTATVAGGSAAEGLFRASGGTDSALALAGQVAPDSSGGTFTTFATPVTSLSGHVGFIAEVAGGSAPAGVFIHVDGTNRLIALEGGVAPGTGGATMLGSGGLIQMDRAGRVVFSIDLTGGDVDSAILEYDPDTDVLRPLLLAGVTVPGTGGATVTRFGPVSVNAAGQIGMEVSLSDERMGVVLASPATVPALPGAGLLATGALIVAAAAITQRRRAAQGRRLSRGG